MDKKKKEIIKQDIADLKWLADKYNKEGQYFKASECLKEMNELKKKVKE